MLPIELSWLGYTTSALFTGIVQSTTGVYDISPWANLTLDKVGTFMDYYTVVIGSGSFSYSATHGLDIGNLTAICEYGKLTKMFLFLVICFSRFIGMSFSITMMIRVLDSSIQMMNRDYPLY